MKTITNNVPRHIIDASSLTPAEREQFDYLDWDAIEDGRGSASFVCYLGELYDLGEFERCGIPGWDGQQTDSAFSATVIRFVQADYDDAVVVGRVYS